MVLETPNFSMGGRVALITGAGRGIGQGIANGLAMNGCAVAIQDIEIEVAQAAADEIKKAGGKAIALGGDIGDLSLPAKLIETTCGEFGGLDVLINNAAIQKHENWLELTPQEMERQWRANLIAPVTLCQLAVPIFREQNWGRIINLGSVQGKGGNPGMMPYAMSKAALENMTRGLARELGKDNITVNMISPGYYNTWRNRDEFQTPDDFVNRSKWIPLRRIGEPEDCAGIALLLCSDAGSYITGQNFYVDGGISAR